MDVARLQAAVGAIAPGAQISKPDPAQPTVISIAGVPPAQIGGVRSVLSGNEYNTYDVAGQPDGSLKLTMKPASVKALETLTLDQSIETIRQRIDSLGVSEPTIQKYGLGDNQILIELPGLDDPSRVEEAIPIDLQARRLRRRRRSVGQRPGRDDRPQQRRPA